MGSKGKDGKPVVKASWACRICAPKLVAETPGYKPSMVDTQRWRGLLCNYGTKNECKNGHEKKDSHLCSYDRLATVLRHQQATPVPPGGKPNWDKDRKLPWKNSPEAATAARDLKAAEAATAKEAARAAKAERQVEALKTGIPFEEIEEEEKIVDAAENVEPPEPKVDVAGIRKILATFQNMQKQNNSSSSGAANRGAYGASCGAHRRPGGTARIYQVAEKAQERNRRMDQD